MDISCSKKQVLFIEENGRMETPTVGDRTSIPAEVIMKAHLQILFPTVLVVSSWKMVIFMKVKSILDGQMDTVIFKRKKEHIKANLKTI